MDAANAAPLPSGQTVAEAVEQLAVKIGEKLEVSNAAFFDGQTVVYLHKRASDLPPQVGVLVEYEGGDETAARTAAMHIAAMKPQFLSRDDVPAETIENERRIAEATAKEQNKPEQAVAEDRRGPGERLLQGRDAARPAVGDRQQDPGQQGARRGGHHASSVSYASRRLDPEISVTSAATRRPEPKM